MRIDPSHLLHPAEPSRPLPQLRNRLQFSHWLAADGGEPGGAIADVQSSRRVFGFGELGMFGRAFAVSGEQPRASNSGTFAETPSLPAAERADAGSDLPNPHEPPATDRLTHPNTNDDTPTRREVTAGASADNETRSRPGTTSTNMARAQATSIAEPGPQGPGTIIAPTLRVAASAIAKAVMTPDESMPGPQPIPQPAGIRAAARAGASAVPLSLAIHEEGGAVTLIARGPGLAETLPRLRKLCTDLLHQFGLRFGGGTVNGSRIDGLIPDRGDMNGTRPR